ncbi:MAG: B12-binding domain-containing radical SAM protein [Deltaproteobacteria bacterium]|nr:B12-binding domain-containing radical SAM protein [Deltaproteobacteria bacterium]
MARKRYRLFLINPRLRYKHYGVQHELSRLLGKRTMTAPLALPLVAALTPDHYSIRIIDEEVGTIPNGVVPDLVGITTLISTIDRGYAIADQYRSMGAKVVMGGTYATFNTAEVLEHADSVVCGEAEGAWTECLADFEKGELKDVYRAGKSTDFSSSVPPRWDLVDTKRINTLSVETSRGCPFNCEFCLVNKMFGRRMRYREIADVVREIEALPIKKILFVDDNLTIHKKRARRLMEAIEPLGISWVCQSSIEVAKDPELLEAMARAGCLSIIIGFESVNPDSLEETRKHHNRVEEYDEAIAAIHAAGINVMGSFIVGFDADTLKSFDDIYQFIDRNNMVYNMLSILTVAPGTDLWRRMEDEGRLYGTNREMMNGALPCLHYMKMSQVDMLDSFVEALGRLFDIDAQRRRALRLLEGGTFLKDTSGKVGFIEKAGVFIRLVGRFAFSKDPARRRLFKELTALGRNGRAAMDKVVLLLLSIEGNILYLDDLRSKLPDIRAAIEKADQGPWEKMEETGSDPIS